MNKDWSKVKRHDWKDGADFELKVQRDQEPDTGEMALHPEKSKNRLCKDCGAWIKVASVGKKKVFCDECTKKRENKRLKETMRRKRDPNSPDFDPRAIT